MQLRFIGVAIVLSLGLVTTMETSVLAGGQKMVEIVKGTLAFTPQEISVKKGEAIRWTNSDDQKHFLTASKTTERQSEELEVKTTQADLLLFHELDPEATYEKAFTDIGTFYYYCGIHNKMWGKINVEE